MLGVKSLISFQQGSGEEFLELQQCWISMTISRLGPHAATSLNLSELEMLDRDVLATSLSLWSACPAWFAASVTPSHFVAWFSMHRNDKHSQLPLYSAHHCPFSYKGILYLGRWFWWYFFLCQNTEEVNHSRHKFIALFFLLVCFRDHGRGIMKFISGTP